jgi:hypothetical protein
MKDIIVMSLIVNMQEDAELFESSVRLQDVATGLKKIIEGQQIEETRSFDWVRDFTRQIDFDSEHYHENKAPEVCVRATRLRPFFFGALSKLRLPWNPKLLERVYDTLNSYGKKVLLFRDELEQARQIYQTMATDILTKLQYAQGMGQI